MIDIPQKSYDMLKEEIACDDSPVGIDATKTHILILHKLMQIEERLDRLIREQSK